MTVYLNTALIGNLIWCTWQFGFAGSVLCKICMCVL